ncbi:hypothetical protein SCHPADRAFT_995189 [Schizopora paradoxa]|uniref:Uncharacterized protein n=1 Tax=Schizopora paradoxa TaxID=27342 RepID=A0A0H2SGY1_9AGAM|nr:hypothetical protein SCHPADRAFT_995189 [Schizopora paradoxa]
MAFLRRSVQNRDTQSHISTPITTISRPTPSTQPPTKVIRALEDYRSQAPQELSFQKGDFFHVVREVNQGQGWYEANNPISGARGLVPRFKFEEFSKSNAAQRISQAAARMPLKSPPPKSGPASPRQPVFYAIVQHDFMAERADELDAKSGDHISVVAQSNFEWFVAKPISRLGRPGLIPVSFVAIHDPGTGRAMTEGEVQNLMLRGEIPGVEEWKKSILEYKAASISLGVLDDDIRGSVPNSPYAQTQQQMMSPPVEEPPAQRVQVNELPPGLPVRCEVVSWHQEEDEYWFRLNALYQPDSQEGSNVLPPARRLTLYRVYQDFFDLQVALKNTFPVEAGDKPARPGEKPTRILPFMPSPVLKITDEVTAIRKDELNGYVARLCKLWTFGADHMLRHPAVRFFFSSRPGDSDEPTEPANWILNVQNDGTGPIAEEDESEQISQPFNGLSVRDASDNRLSDGSRYEDDGIIGNRASDGRTVGSGYGRNMKSPPPMLDGERSDPRSHSPFPSTSTARTQSPLPTNRASTSSTRNYSAEAAMARSTSTRSRNDVEQVITYNGQRRQSDESPRSFSSSIPSQLPSSSSANGGRARSMSNANSPAISATNPNPAFVKIKIFDRLTQDLIAIRVNPRVTHVQLMDKVRARLGEDVHQLAYRNSITNTFLGLDDDAALKDWLENTDKHVLYAD